MLTRFIKFQLVLFTILALLARGWAFGLFTVLAFLLIDSFRLWDDAMQTLGLVLLAGFAMGGQQGVVIALAQRQLI